ncbi:TrkA family potassium uptake protein [Micromonospora sp. CV4]|uniref:potassium channel family protein n=1 Tax=Micromonospora sp. CV4 TaxID=2478711 RepID=UPI000EF48078|nr:TrkA family potassium uptake protein [Micromonospora sp. CV4]RLP92357.1 TrkA family potassium uptake protein [Micromonospora sp. CV4]RLP92372.1 TrkA family potassium uptake protein [Micromonospora sp. CV4]
MSARRANGSGVVVVGLGRFGSQLARSLTRMDREVLAIDHNPDRVQRWSDQLDRVVQADSTEEGALRQLGVASFERAVVAIGASVEASVLTVLALVELGLSQIWARATSQKHAKILSSVGAHHVIFPEAETGDRVAHLIVSRLLDFIEFDDDFAIATVRVPESLVGRTVLDLRPDERYEVRVIGAKLPGERFRYASDSTKLLEGGLLVVEGGIDQVQRFAGLR